MKYSLFYASLISILIPACQRQGQTITMNELLDEMVDLNRLPEISSPNYRTVQFSSYDRRSKTPADTTWFANEDGFGGEPVPGFEKVLMQPDSGGIGEYLICDIQSPGVIQRLWTAAISGEIRLFLDDVKAPVYEGNASDFFRNPLEQLAGLTSTEKYSQTIRQYDAFYLPVPFARRCRMEWIGDIKEPHFYHIGIRIYDPDVKVETFRAGNFSKYIQKLDEINNILTRTESLNHQENADVLKTEIRIDANASDDLFKLEGNKSIVYLAIKIKARDEEIVLRQSVLNIYFDDVAVPQVHSPSGDFFGAAPGVNPFESLPFSVLPDSAMLCRFVMPFKKSARIEIVNHSDESIKVLAGIKTTPYKWNEGRSMYFFARWKISHNITAHNRDSEAEDIQYLKALGAGRIVGTAAYLYNPCNATVSWGNWWGEGDEKIFIDRDTFPSYFGTGSEDYFNYSWSSPDIFSYPYCGQPRNDGPGNRGYVSNFRWHIADDIPFKEKVEYNMELRHHDIVPNFTYGRIIYFYGSPFITDDYKKIEMGAIRELPYLIWSPEAYLGSAGYTFIQAEKLAKKNPHLFLEKNRISAEGNILSWIPEQKDEKLQFKIPSKKVKKNTRIGLTMAHSPGGGMLIFILNGKRIKFDDKETVSLLRPYRTVLDNHFSEEVTLYEGDNELIIEMQDADGSKTAWIDFIWIRE